MRMKLYNFLVNRQAGIRVRYHSLHDNQGIFGKYFSWIYLFFLNFAFYILRCRFLGKNPKMKEMEEKRLPLDVSESRAHIEKYKDLKGFIEKLSGYDVISFDIFDTLIFRPFSEPTDAFYFIGEKIGFLDFRRIRMEQELLSRTDCFQKKRHNEVGLADIWQRIEQEVGISAETGMKLEQELELEFCYANPFMLEVFRKLLKMGKKIIIISDMYLPKDFLVQLLEKNGYIGFSNLYVSCEYGVSKGNGKLFALAKKNLPENVSVIHVGDNEHSDVKMAKQAGFASLYYPNVNKMALSYRAYDMSPIVGGAYRGIVDNYLYQGTHSYSMEYEYGFIYGGLFVLGYCQFVHRYCGQNNVDKILFLSRDGDILKQVYDRLYLAENTSYVYWSRAAATKLMAEYNKYDYIRRYIRHKVNQQIPVKKILASMEVEFLAEKLSTYVDLDNNGKKTDITLSDKDVLTDRNAEALKRFVLKYFPEIIDTYCEQNEAAKCYYFRELEGCRKAVAVDIGWAGSGAMSLSYLVEKVWQFPCEVTGIIAGTNTVHNAEPDASEAFLQSGKLVSYLFSLSHNRDIMKKHDLNKDYNVFWELLLSSPTKQFLGFGFKKNPANINVNDLSQPEQGTVPSEIELHFGKLDANQEGIQEIQEGIIAFVEEYMKHFKKYPYMLNISGRDAYAPMLLAASHGEKYLKVIEEKFALETGVS